MFVSQRQSVAVNVHICKVIGFPAKIRYVDIVSGEHANILLYGETWGSDVNIVRREIHLFIFLLKDR